MGGPDHGLPPSSFKEAEISPSYSIYKDVCLGQAYACGDCEGGQVQAKEMSTGVQKTMSRGQARKDVHW